MLVNGTTGNDQLSGSDSGDTITGGAGNDTLDGLAGNDSLDGGEGNDLFLAHAGNDSLRGGLGSDTFIFNGSSGQDLIVDFNTSQDFISISPSAVGGGVVFGLNSVGNTLLTLEGGATIVLNALGSSQWVNIKTPTGASFVTEYGDDFSATMATTGRAPLDVGATTGTINRTGDEDWFAVDVTGGTRYTFTLSGVAGGGGTLANPLLKVISTAGQILTSDDDSGTGNDSLITYTPTESGKIYLAASGVASAVGTYRLTASTKADGDDYAASTGTTGRVNVNGPAVSGNLETGADDDWFAVNLTAGNVYRFTLTGIDGGGGTLADPVLWVRDASGTLVGSNDNSGTSRDSVLSFLAPGTGVFYLNPWSIQGGTYRLTATLVSTADDYAASSATTGRVAIGGSAAGTIGQASDVDWFAVDVVAGAEYSFTLTSNGGTGGLPGTNLELRTGTGVLRLSDSTFGTSSPSEIIYTATATERLYLAASGWLSSETGTYTVAARNITDDYADSSSTTGKVAIGGSATGVIGKTNDVDWFAVDVVAGTDYVFTLAGGSAAGSLPATSLRLVTASGVFKASNISTSNASPAEIAYTATATERLYLAASGWLSSQTGTYTVAASAVIDDYSNDASTKGLVTLGGSVTGTIGKTGDKDWFAFDMVAGTAYIFTLSGKDGGGGTVGDPWLDLYSSTGAFLGFDSDSGTGLDSQLTYTATSTGRVYLSASAYGTGTYKLSAAEAPDDFRGNSTTTGTLTIGGSATGLIERDNDKDWFAVNVVAGQEYAFTVSGKSGTGGLAGSTVELFNAAGLSLGRDTGLSATDAAEVIYKATATETLYVSASGWLSYQTGTYTVAARTIIDDFTADTSTTGLLKLGSPVKGSIDKTDDKDWIAFDAVAGTAYTFTLSGKDGGGGTLVDPDLTLYSSAGFTLALDYDSGTGLDSQITYTAATSGRIYLSAYSLLSFSRGIGTYTLSVAEAADDFRADTGTTGVVTVGGDSVSGLIERSGDKDWFGVDVTAGTRYYFRMGGAGDGSGTLSNPVLELLSSNGTVQASDDNSGAGLDAEIAYTATSTGRLYLAAASGYSWNSGTYKVSAVADIHAGDRTTTGTVAINGSVTASIDGSSDKDWFAVDVTAGDIYIFTLSGKDGNGGTLIDPRLDLYSSTGSFVTTDDNSGTGNDAQVTWLATETGKIYLSASAGTASSGQTGTYRLSAARAPDDFSANSTTKGTLSVDGGSTTGNIELTGDKDWFAIDVVAGTRYQFDLSGADGGGGTLPDPTLQLVTATGEVLSTNYDSGTGFDALMTFTASSTGRLYLAVSSDNLATTKTGTYKLSSKIIPAPDDYGDNVETTGRLWSFTTASGRLEKAGDSDWFAVSLTAGTRYVIDLKSADGTGGRLANPLAQLRDSSGALILQDDDTGEGTDAQLSFTANATGTFYVAASSSDGVQTGHYSLRLTRLDTDDYSADTATTGRLSVGTPVWARLEQAGDQDWFAIDLVAGQTYTFSLAGLSSGVGTLFDPELVLRDSTGAQLAIDDDGGADIDSLMSFTATSSGRYYLTARSHEAGLSGTYRIHAFTPTANAADAPGVRGDNPNDPLFAQQWHLNGAFGINVQSVWADYTGTGIRVGVLDQGVDFLHRDLDDNLIRALSSVAATGASGGAPVTTDDNHGTAVAGVIAAERNGFGGVGVAYNADLVAYYDSLAGAITDFAATTASAFQRGIGSLDVLNNSWGFGNFFRATPNAAFVDNFGINPFNASGAALARLAAEGRDGKGTVVVQAAGNTGQFGDDTNLHNFQNSRFAITVAATDKAGKLASFSTPGASVLVAAPGVGVVTADRSGPFGYALEDSTALDGTSFSAPAVAGVVALMLEANSDLGYRDVQEILALSARQINATGGGWATTGTGAWNGGGMHYSHGYGFGLVDARAAVRLAETWQGQDTVANEKSLSASTTLANPIDIPDRNSTGISNSLRLTGDLTIDRVEVDLLIDHTWIGDLKVTLTSPGGTVMTLVDRPGQGRLNDLGSSQDNIRFTFGVAGLLGEQAAGDWRLTVSDNDALFWGKLNGWSLRAYGETGSADDNHVFTDEFVSLLAATPARGTITDTDGGTDTLNAAAVTGAVSVNLGAGSGSIAGKSITFTANAFERAIGGDAADTLTAGTNAAALLGGRGADTLTGGAGFDTLTGGAGDDRLIGGDGIDFAVFAGDRSAFTLTRDGDGFLLTGTDGSDRLSGVELAVFNRGAIFLGGAGASLFNEAGYLAANPDVAAAVRAGALSSGQAHYEAFGRAEGRPGATGLSLFDEAFYLSRYADIASAVRNGVFESGYAHYQMYGRTEGRNPSLYFDTDYYLTKNPDVAGAVRAGAILAVDHYLNYGLNEGREASPYFNAADYLRINPDVAAAGLNAVRHFLTYGYAEGRLAGIDWDYFG